MSETSPSERIQQLWDQLMQYTAAGDARMVVEKARELDGWLRDIPDELPGSAARPGIEGMRRFAVVCAALGRVDEAIEWRIRRAVLLREFLSRDPKNSLGLFTQQDLRDELAELAHLYDVSGQTEKARAILEDWEEAARSLQKSGPEVLLSGGRPMSFEVLRHGRWRYASEVEGHVWIVRQSWDQYHEEFCEEPPDVNVEGWAYYALYSLGDDPSSYASRSRTYLSEQEAAAAAEDAYDVTWVPDPFHTGEG